MALDVKLVRNELFSTYSRFVTSTICIPWSDLAISGTGIVVTFDTVFWSWWWWWRRSVMIFTNVPLIIV